MSTATKRPESDPAPAREYKAHFELWDEAAIDDADAPPLQNGRRVWNTPVLSVKPFALPPRRRAVPLPPPPTTRESLLWITGAVVGGAFLAVLIMRPWEYSMGPASQIAMTTTTKPAPKRVAPPKPATKIAVAVPKSPPKVAAAPKAIAAPKAVPSVDVYAKQSIAAAKVVVPPKIVASPEVVPSVDIYAKQSITAPAKGSAAAPSMVAARASVKPIAMPPVAAAPPKPVSSPVAPVKVAVAPPAKVAPVPQLKPLAMPAAPVKVASVPMPKQAAMHAPSRPAAENAPDSSAVEEQDNQDNDDELAPVRRMLLESSIRTQLAGAGFPDLGVSMTEDGDVYLNGTFLNLADEDKVIAMIRAHRGVGDIYFSGTVWHDLTASPDQAAVPAASAPMPNVASAKGASAQQVAKLPPTASQPVSVKHVKIAHSADFPVTAAEVPVPKPRYAAPQPTVVPTPIAKPRSLFPFKWFNKLRG
jgi:hypothetical protein